MTKKRLNPDDPTILEVVHDRRLAIVAAIAQHPGLSFDDLRDALADATGKRWAPATIYEDIKHLKAMKLLSGMRHRSGYFLVGPTTKHEDMRILLNGLRIQAEDLQNPVAKALYHEHERRHARTKEDHAYFGYPVEALGNRPVVRSTNDAFSQLMEELRKPILLGQKVRVRQVREAWGKKGSRDHEIFPLQFIFNDVAWYLLAESAEKHTFFLLRLDRLSPVVYPIAGSARGASAQTERLKLAQSLLAQSWGFIFPPHDRNGKLLVDTVTAKVRFDKDKAPFILEANQRHDSQDIVENKDKSVDYLVTLPDQKTIWLFFKSWVMEWGASAEILEPAWLRDEIATELAKAAARYQPAEATAVVPAVESEPLAAQSLE